MKAWNYIKNDCDQETGKKYFTIVQIIVKDDRGKAIAWRSASCKMTCYHLSDEKNSINSQYAFCTQSAFCILYLVCILRPVCSLQSAICSDRIGITVFVRTSLKSGPKYWGSERNCSEIILAPRIDVAGTVHWRAPEDKHNDRAIIRVALCQPIFNCIGKWNSNYIFVFLCSGKTKLDFHFCFSFFLVRKEMEFEFI